MKKQSRPIAKTVKLKKFELPMILEIEGRKKYILQLTRYDNLVLNKYTSEK